MAESPEEIAQQQQELEAEGEEEEQEKLSVGYKVPDKTTIQDIVNKDTEDESLRKYKEALLGQAGATGTNIVIDASNPSNVIVESMTLVSDGKDIKELDLRGAVSGKDLNKRLQQDTPIVMKEGATYQTRIKFHVQREIVTGLKYVQKVKRSLVPAGAEIFMMGSFAPKAELHQFESPKDELPKGMTARGTYKVHSLFTDDDGHKYLEWEWNMKLSKDWN